MLRNLEYIACYYITGSYATQDYGYCMRVKYYRDLAYAVSFLPYYWRAMQVKSKLNMIPSFPSFCFLFSKLGSPLYKNTEKSLCDSVQGGGLTKAK